MRCVGGGDVRVLGVDGRGMSEVDVVSVVVDLLTVCFFFQAEDGIRDAQESRGLGDVYKRQPGGGIW